MWTVVLSTLNAGIITRVSAMKIVQSAKIALRVDVAMVYQRVPKLLVPNIQSTNAFSRSMLFDSFMFACSSASHSSRHFPYSGLFVACTSAFAPAPVAQTGVSLRSSLANEVDSVGNNIAVKSLLQDVEASGLLTKVAQSGLLSKAQEAGISLSKLEPLLALAAENKEILILVEAATPELLPLLPKVVEVAPGALPLLATAVTISPGTLSALGLASLAAAGGAVVVIPDDSIVSIAAQTLAVGGLGAAGAAALVGSSILGKLTN